MSTKNNSSILSPTGRLFFAGLMAMTFLTVRLQGQYVSTDVSNNILNSPYGVATDPANNAYIADTANNRIVEYNYNGKTVSTLAGSTSGLSGTNNGAGTAARFYEPQGIVYASGRGGLVVVDQANQELRLVTLAGVVTTLPLTGVALSYPKGIAVANDDVTLYVADQGNNAIRAVSPGNVVSTLATNYTYNAVTYPFHSPAAVAVDNNSNIWATDSLNQVICKISPGGVAVGIAGMYRTPGTNDSQTASSAQFNLPSGLFWDNAKQMLVISDTGNDTIRGLFVTNAAYAVQTLAGLAGLAGFIDGPLTSAKFFRPLGLSSDPSDSGYFVVDGGNNALRVLQPTQPPPAPVVIATPVIGYLSFPIVNGNPSAQFNPITAPISTFNNTVDLAIEQNDGTVSTFMNYGPTGSPPIVTNEFVDAFNSGDVGLLPNQVPNLNIPTIPALTLTTISTAPGRPSSPSVSAQIQYVTANPNIIGSDAAGIILSNVTVGAQMFYALDNSTNQPTNDGSYGIGPVTTGTTLSLNITSNTTLKVRAFTPGFSPSGTVSEALTLANFVANQLTFGFASGEASSTFITTGGRYFFAPVTLSLLPAATMYTLQFNMAEFGGGGSPVNPGTWEFNSMIVQPIPGGNGLLEPIPPGIVIVSGGVTNVQDRNPFPIDNMLGVAWITIPPDTNLYNTPGQDLINESLPHERLFLAANQQVVCGDFDFKIPTASPVGNTYTIQLGLASASTFASGSSFGVVQGVLVQTPTNGSLIAGAINSIKTVIVTNSVSYLVGDAYPFRWFNAGDFGDSNLLNDDVLEVYQSAIYGISTPPVHSDFYNSMDSGNGSYNNLYDAVDTDINGITDGDGSLLVDDVYVTLKRSLDTNLTWWIRTWTDGSATATYTPFTNFISDAAHAVVSTNTATRPTPGPARSIAVAAGQVQAGGNLTVQVPIQVVSADPIYPARVLMLDVELDPLDGSPPITSAVALSSGSSLGASTLSSSLAINECGAAWLDSTVAGVSGTNVICTLSVTLPSNVTSNSAYRVHFNHFSASPNGLAVFNSTTQDGLITVGNRNTSSWHDNIPDSWRLLWFGTVSNALSVATADPDGDGANNWQEYVAGTNPNDPASVFQFMGGSTLGGSSFSLLWPSVPNKHYTVQTSYTLSPGSWTTLATNIVGTGQPMTWTDSNATGKIQYYRAFVK